MKKLLFVCFLFLFLVQNVKGIEYNIVLNMYPNQGNIYSKPLLRVSLYPLETSERFWASVFWDDICIIYRKPDTGIGIWGDPRIHSWDMNLTILKEYPYSNLGYHNVTVVIEDQGLQQRLNKTITFLITDYYPPTSDWWQWWENVPDSIKQQLKGDKGNTGSQGPQGIQGPQGQIGPQGPVGEVSLTVLLLVTSIGIIGVVSSITTYQHNKTLEKRLKVLEEQTQKEK